MTHLDRVSDSKSQVVYTNLIPFEKIFDGSHAIENQTVDLLGEVVNVGSKISVVDTNGSVPFKRIKLIRFALRDLSGSQIQCVAYDQQADFFDSNVWSHNFWNSFSKPIVTILSGWRVTYQSPDKTMVVSSDSTISKIYFNSELPEAADFRMRLAVDNLQYLDDASDASDDYSSDD